MTLNAAGEACGREAKQASARFLSAPSISFGETAHVMIAIRKALAAAGFLASLRCIVRTCRRHGLRIPAGHTNRQER